MLFLQVLDRKRLAQTTGRTEQQGIKASECGRRNKSTCTAQVQLAPCNISGMAPARLRLELSPEQWEHGHTDPWAGCCCQRDPMFGAGENRTYFSRAPSLPVVPSPIPFAPWQNTKFESKSLCKQHNRKEIFFPHPVLYPFSLLLTSQPSQSGHSSELTMTWRQKHKPSREVHLVLRK